MISKVMGVMSKMQLPLVVLHKDISKAAVIKEIVGKAARARSRGGDDDNFRRQFTSCEYLLHSIYQKYHALYGGNEHTAKMALELDLAKVLKDLRWYLLPGGRVHGDLTPPLLNVYVFNIKEEPVMNTLGTQLADIDTPRDRVLCLSAYKDQAIDAGNEDASPQAHEELITENASIIKLFCDAYLISLGRRFPKRCMVKKRGGEEASRRGLTGGEAGTSRGP
jgi:hypothetical protein